MTLVYTPEQLGARVENCHVHHARYTDILERLRDMHAYATASGAPQHCMIVGPSGMGKTRLAKSYLAEYPVRENLVQTIIPALYAEVPPKPTIKAFSAAILGQYDEHYVYGTSAQMSERLVNLLTRCETRLLIVDETQHFVERGTRIFHSGVADWFKALINRTGIAVVLLGLPNVRSLMRANHQLRRRFSAMLELSPWSLHNREEMLGFCGVIKAVESHIHLPEAAGLYRPETAIRLMYATDGRIGYLVRLLAWATVLAARDNASRIRLEHLERAFRERIWMADSPEHNPFSPTFRPRRLDRAGEPFEPSGE